MVKAYKFSAAAWVRVSGEDAWDYLQSQFSNDLKPVESGERVYGFFLDRKGKVVVDAFIWKESEETYRVFSYFCQGEDIVDKLEENIVADDVDIFLENVEGVALWGDVSSLQFQLPEKHEVVKDNGVVAIKGRRSSKNSYDLFFIENEIDLGDVEYVSDEELHSERIIGGVPAVGMDLVAGDFPNEGGVAGVGVAYNKGCYLGQEVMMRLHTMGKVQKSLYKVELDCCCENLPKSVSNGGKTVGELRSCVAYKGSWLGLAMLKNRALEEGVELKVEDRGVIKILAKAGTDE